MSNNMNTPTIRWHLLSTVSAFALLTSTCTASAAGNEADRPLIWIELGGQMENVSGQGDVFAPAFMSAYSTSSVLWKGVTPLQAQRPSKFGFGEEGKILFQPEGSDWVFSAGIRYGRSSNVRHVDHQTNETHYFRLKYGAHATKTPSAILTTADFADTQAHHKESHAILDFSAGKDVGLGLFGKNSSSVVSFGVRIAQFTSGATFDIRARPDLQIVAHHFTAFHLTKYSDHFHSYHATGHASRSFHGVGPSLSWNASTPFVGSPQDGEITFDWGANASFLFGKQKARVRHHEIGIYYPTHLGAGAHIPTGTQLYSSPGGHSTSRSVTVPNVGGFAGISFQRGGAKISFGYRADFFFGAMDTGIDAAKKSNASFNGPYASISIGLGD
jgi:hypothetical protein